VKIALIGGTGFVGSVVLKELLQRDHQVTALARNPEKYSLHPRLKVMVADALDAQQVAIGVAEHDAVVSAYNPGWDEPRIHELFLQAYEAIIAGLKQAGLKRLLIVGGVGSLYMASGLQLVDAPEFPAIYKNGALASREALNRLRAESSLERTFLSPPAVLERGERRGSYRIGGEQLLLTGEQFAGISLEDLAVAIADEIERPRHIRKQFTVAY